MLLKAEKICPCCSTQFIVVLEKKDLKDLQFCPFCGTDVFDDEKDNGEEE